MKKKLIVLFVILAMLVPVTSAKWQNFGNSGDAPKGSTLVINVNYKVKNSYDSGLVGYWAKIDYNERVQVWETPEGWYYVIVHDTGKWETYEGALSPNAGTAQSMDISGVFHGGYTMRIDGGLLEEPLAKNRGYVGSSDWDGTQEYIELGTYSAQGPPILTPWRWHEQYFEDGYTRSYIEWGWTYRYKNQSWNNYHDGNSGEILA